MLNKHFFNIMKNCLYVGSFNPITIAHEQIAKDLLNNNIIDKIYFLPVNSKKNDLVSIEHRINMINLIKNKNIEILNIYNYDKKGLFNYDILKEINITYNITHLVMGSDLFYKFNTFNNYQNILKEYNIIIIKRDNKITDYINNNYDEYKNKIKIIDKLYDGSSLLAKKSLNKKNKYLEKDIINYIIKNNLYKNM